jgi:hypothetical protein
MTRIAALIAVTIAVMSMAGCEARSLDDLDGSTQGATGGAPGGTSGGAPGATGGAPGGTSGGAPGATGGAPGGTGGADWQATLPPAAAALCAATGGNEITFQDEADAQAHLIGSWILCRPPGLSWATEQPDQHGIELDADMSWHILHWVGDTLMPTDGFQASGSYRFQPPQHLDYGPAMDAMLFFGLDYSFVTATMLDSPRKMLWSNGALYAREPDAN